MKRNRSSIPGNSQVRRQKDPIPWKYCVLTAVCGLILMAGFFAAAKIHFSTVDYAMKNAELRSKLTKLKDEKRRLVLSKERASSPAQIAKLAGDRGFVRHVFGPQQTESEVVVPQTEEVAPGIVATVSSRPVEVIDTQKSVTKAFGKVGKKIEQIARSEEAQTAAQPNYKEIAQFLAGED
ncbi:MAG: hypothetical protein R2684_16370 [Pyrinomonadaceae bacterium]